MPGGFHYRITEEGDLLLFGVQGDLNDPSEAPYYAERERIRRVITARGAVVGARALLGFPSLRVAILSGARSVGDRALAGCPQLTAVLCDPTIHHIAESAFAHCPSLTMIDYAGPPAAALSALPPQLASGEGARLRAVPSAEGDTLAEGALGHGMWRLTADGTLTVAGDNIPDYNSFRETPWFAHRASIRRAVLSEGVHRVGTHAFSLAPALQTVAVTDATEIGDFAFAHCASLFRADLFPTVRSIGHYAFAGCGLLAAFPGASVCQLGRGVYDECSALRTLLLPFLPFTAEGDPIGSAPALRRTLCLEEDLQPLRTLRLPHLRPLARHPLPAKASRALSRATARRERVALALHAVEDSYREADTARLSVLSRLGNALHTEEGAQSTPRELAAAAKDATRLARSLDRLASRTEGLFREVARARSAVQEAHAQAALLFPFDGAYTEGVLDVSTYIESVTVTPPQKCRAAATRAARLPEEITGGVAGEAMRTVSNMATLLGIDSAGGGSAAPPCILVLGGDPLRDAAVAATARAVRRAGGIPAINPASPGEGSYDALILCDGGPIDPYLYGAVRGTGPVNEGRDTRDAAFFDAFFLYGKPILGVGRGCELVNVLLGGTLSHTLPQASLATHSGGAVHPVLCEAGFLCDIYGKTGLSCISAHEASIGTVGQELAVVARAQDGVTEAIAHSRLPIYGVMFNPERMLEPESSPEAISDGTRLFAWFVTAAKKSRREKQNAR